MLNANPQDTTTKLPNNKPSQSLTDSQTQYLKFIQSCLPIFEKPYEHRTANELALINKLIPKINFLKSIEILASTQAVKSLLKFGKIIRVSENKLIYEAGTPLDYFVIGLSGRFATVGQTNLTTTKGEQPYFDYVQKLKQFSPKYLQFLRKKQHSLSKSFKPLKINPNQFQISAELTTTLDTELPFLSPTLFLHPNETKNSPVTTFSRSSECYLFEIDFKKLCEIMREEHNKSILAQVEIFARFGCFRLFKKEKLRQIVEEIPLIKFKKTQKIFQQTDQDQRIFILLKGEIQLEKMALLGNQNPNNLYKNRLSLKRSSHNTRARQKISAIPFADFSKLYNASSELKKVKLTRLSPISIFGQQEILAQTARQTTATVISQTAELYVFTLEEVCRYFTSDSQYKGEDFLRVLSGQITEKKMLYRQEKLGGEVEWLSKSLKGGFYIQDEGSSPRGKRSIVANMNRTIPVKLESIKTIDNEDEQNKMFLTATFNCHNFEQFYESQSPKMPSKKALQVTPSVSHQQKPIRTPLTVQEKQILKLLHGNEQTIIKTANSSRGRTSRGTFAIDFQKPLFTPEYFKQQADRSRRIDKDMKKSKLNNLYQSNQGFGSTSKSRTLSNSVVKNKGGMTGSGFRRNLSYQI